MVTINSIKLVQKKIKSGLKEDIDNLTSVFDEMGSIRFADFSRLWRENSFSFLFTYKLNESDLREFIEEAFEVILKELKKSVSPERAIFILYLVYCVYMCQPVEPKVPIKLNLSRYKALNFLFNESRINKHLDACLIWMKLLSLGAFHLTAEIKSYGPLSVENNPTPPQPTTSIENYPLDCLREMETELENLKDLHHFYVSFKDNLEGPGSEEIKKMALVNNEVRSQPPFWST